MWCDIVSNIPLYALNQQVLDGELAQRADATRKLREVQKQLMLLGGLVPPSPVVTAAAAAAARIRRNSSNAGSHGGDAGCSTPGLSEEAVLMQEAKRLQDAIDGHTRSVKVSIKAMPVVLLCAGSGCWPPVRVRVYSACAYGGCCPAVAAPCVLHRRLSCLQELQEQWERARAEEQCRGAGAADVRRWTGIRNIVEAREMLRTLFISACTQRAQVGVVWAQHEVASIPSACLGSTFMLVCV